MLYYHIDDKEGVVVVEGIISSISIIRLGPHFSKNTLNISPRRVIIVLTLFLAHFPRIFVNKRLCEDFYHTLPLNKNCLSMHIHVAVNRKS